MDRFYRFVWDDQESGYTLYLTHDHADAWMRYLARRNVSATHKRNCQKAPKSAVTPDDWEWANSRKIPSLVWVSLDTGLRPVEVERSRMSWIDTDNAVLRIPKEDSAKTREHWVVGLSERTAEALGKWCTQRRNYSSYDETEAIWLTRQGTVFDTSSLRYLLHRLCEIAGIETDNRQMSWYAIHHSVGTYMTREEDLAAAQAQLRHRSPETTMKYDQTPVEDR